MEIRRDLAEEIALANCSKCGRTLWRGRVSQMCEECEFKERAERERASLAAKEQAAQQAEAAVSTILMTTEVAHNLPVERRLGIVSGECVFGLNIVKDFFAGVRDVVGGRSATIQRAIKDAQKEAQGEMALAASELGADAIVAVSFTHTQMSSGAGTMIAVVATGTAVKLAEQPA